MTHCFLRRHALASKIQSLPLKEMLSTSVKVVNFVRTRAWNHRIFKKLCQFLDIFSHLNEVNLCIQRPDLTIMDVTERLQAFQANLPLWKRKQETNNFSIFPMLEEMISKSRIDNTEALASFLRRNMCEKLDRLHQSLKR